MAYYTPYQSQYYTQMQAQNPVHIPQPAPVQNNQSSLIWVQGIEAAKSYLVAPNTTVLLMDSEKERFFLKSSDASGMPLPLRVFEYTEIVQSGANKPSESQTMDLSSYATKAELDAFKDEIQGILKNVPKQVTKKEEIVDA